MTTSQRLTILLLSLGMSSGALAWTTGGPLTLADVQDKAHAAWGVLNANMKEQSRQYRHHHLRSLQSFAETCALTQDALQGSGFTCSCGTDTLTCKMESDCSTDGVCADYEFSMTYNDAGTGIEAVSVCVKYTADPTGEARDVCVSMGYGSDMTTIESCQVQIENDSGVLTSCNKCEPCNDGASLDIDCTNFAPEATTNGCTALDVSGGGAQSALQNLGGSAGAASSGSNSTAGGSTGGGTITPGNSTTGGSTTGGSTNGGSDGGDSSGSGSDGGSSNGAGTSSGVALGARALMLMSGVALVLIM